MTGVAAGNIKPSRFLIQATSADNKYSQASSATAAPLVGISQPGTRNTPYSSLDDGYAAIAGENLHVYKSPDNAEAPLQLGGTVAAGDLLTTDSDGRGVTATTGDFVGARAQQAGVADQIVTVVPVYGISKA